MEREGKEEDLLIKGDALKDICSGTACRKSLFRFIERVLRTSRFANMASTSMERVAYCGNSKPQDSLSLANSPNSCAHIGVLWT